MDKISSKTGDRAVSNLSPREDESTGEEQTPSIESCGQISTAPSNGDENTGLAKQVRQPLDDSIYASDEDGKLLTTSESTEDDGASSDSKKSSTDSPNGNVLNQTKDVCLDLLKQIKVLHSGNVDVKFNDILLKLHNIFATIMQAHWRTAQVLGGQIISYMMEEGVDDIFFALVMETLFRTEGKSDSSVSDVDKISVSCVVGMIQNFTDISEVFSKKACESPGLLEALAEALLFRAVLLQGTDPEEDYLFPLLLDSIYNCSLYDANRKRIREVGLVWILKRVLKCSYCIQAAIALAGVLDEQESQFFNTKKDAIARVATLLAEAVQTNERRFQGFSAKELAIGCSRLARNEVNLNILMDADILKPLLQLCKVGDYEEQKEALTALWALSYGDENKQKILDTDDMIETVRRLKHSEDRDVRTESVNILCTLANKLKSSTNPNFQRYWKELSASITQISTSDNPTHTYGKHIMISYNWSSHDIIDKIDNALQDAGYQVWRDKTKMTGSMIDCIVSGLDNADVMLMCISQKYKDSTYCRSEADYAFNNNISIIPLLVEPGYTGDGWIQFIKGSKLHINFSEENNFNWVFQKLEKEIGNRGKCLTGTKPADEPDTQLPHGTIGTDTLGLGKATVVNWSKDDVRKWLQDNDCFREPLDKITGKQLLFLKNLKKQASGYFYKYLKTEMNMELDLNHLTNFVGGLDGL